MSNTCSPGRRAANRANRKLLRVVAPESAWQRASGLHSTCRNKPGQNWGGLEMGEKCWPRGGDKADRKSIMQGVVTARFVDSHPPFSARYRAGVGVESQKLCGPQHVATVPGRAGAPATTARAGWPPDCTPCGCAPPSIRVPFHVKSGWLGWVPETAARHNTKALVLSLHRFPVPAYPPMDHKLRTSQISDNVDMVFSVLGH